MHMEEKNEKRTSIKDNSVRNVVADLFAYVFSTETALVNLYRGLGKEIAVEDIEYISLNDELGRNNRYNDTAFRTKDNRIIVFVEHQSTQNKNMPFRFLEYAVDVMRILKVLSDQNRFGEKLMTFPKLEFYVAYNGEKPLKEENKNLVVDLGDVRVSAQVVDICFDELPKQMAENPNDELAGYSYFVKMFREMKSQGKTPHDAYHDAVGKSKEMGYLAHIWSRKELVDMFLETYCHDEILREEGMEKGLEKGLEISALIFNALKENLPIQAIAEKYGVKSHQVEKMKRDFAI